METLKWPTTAAEWCKYYKALDEKYNTSKDSPLHHDNRCILMFREN